MKWLQGLLVEVEKVQELIDSDSLVAAGETIIGEVPEDLRKLFSYCEALRSRILELKKEADETDSKKVAGELWSLSSRMEERYQLAAHLFWAEIRFEFKDRADPHKVNFCIRKGWQVTTKAQVPRGPEIFEIQL